MGPVGQCPICNGTVETAGRLSEGDKFFCECPVCGTYTLSGTAHSLALDFTDEERAKFRGWVYDQNSLDTNPIISSETLSRIKTLRPLSFLEKTDRMLLALASEATRLGGRVQPSNKLIRVIHGASNIDVGFIGDALEEMGFLARLPGGGEFRITPKGYIRIDELRFRQTSSTQGFVAMWFTDELRSVYESGFERAIESAGYDPFRIDRHEHTNKMDDEIIAQIRRSRFMVADFTGHRGGVYFEAGFALGLDIPVIWTCRKNDIEGLHFDIRQYNCIDWEEASDLARRLQVRIEALIGDGPKKL